MDPEEIKSISLENKIEYIVDGLEKIVKPYCSLSERHSIHQRRIKAYAKDSFNYGVMDAKKNTGEGTRPSKKWYRRALGCILDAWGQESYESDIVPLDNIKNAFKEYVLSGKLPSKPNTLAEIHIYKVVYRVASTLKQRKVSKISRQHQQQMRELGYKAWLYGYKNSEDIQTAADIGMLNIKLIRFQRRKKI